MAIKKKQTAGKTRRPVVSRQKWLSARVALLKKEKEFTRRRDKLSEQRRKLPWVQVDKEYVFDMPDGKRSLADLFDNRSQLIVYHFMFGPDWNEGCKHCSFWADHFDPTQIHLNHRDVTFVVISRAPIEKLSAFKSRMGWKFNWLSSFNNDFNFDFGVSFTPQELKKGTAFYNYRKGQKDPEREGLSVFYKNDRGEIFHTYSTFARGIDLLCGTYNFLDLVPRGRDEGDSPQYWVQYHDRYNA